MDAYLEVNRESIRGNRLNAVLSYFEFFYAVCLRLFLLSLQVE